MEASHDIVDDIKDDVDYRSIVSNSTSHRWFDSESLFVYRLSILKGLKNRLHQEKSDITTFSFQ